MADISKIVIPGGSEYDLKDAVARDRSAYFLLPVEPEEGSTTTHFDFVVPGITELKNGICFIARNNTSTSASGYVFNVNNLGDKPVYQSDGTRSSTGFKANISYLIWYNEDFVEDGCWFYGVLSDKDTTYSTFTTLNGGNGCTYIANSVINRYQLVFQMDDDYITPLNNANSNGTTKTMLTNVEFDPFGRIFYHSPNGSTAAGERPSYSSLQYTAALNARYTFNCGTTLTAYKPFYLVVTPQPNGKVRIASSKPWSQTLPTTNDGNWYILLGRTYTTYNMSLFADHPVFYHDGTKIRQKLLRQNIVMLNILSSVLKRCAYLV